MQKFKNIICPNTKKNHYYGWYDVIENVKRDLIDINSDVILDTWLDSILWKNANKKDYNSKWMGIIHSVEHDYYFGNDNDLHNNTIKTLISHPFINKNINDCEGIITLCNHTKKVIENYINIPVYHTYHPKPKEAFENKFDVKKYMSNPNIYQSGFHGRNFRKFLDFNTSIRKKMNVYNWWNEKYVQSELENSNDSIQIENRFLNDQDYILNLTTSIGFSYYYDVAASNALLEHIVTTTPIIVNKLPAVIEYIGEKYPMFYENIKDMPDKYLLNESFINETHQYLIERSKLDIFTINNFKNDIISFIQQS